VIPGCKTRTGAPALCFTSFADGVTLSASWRHRHCWVQDLLWRSRFVFHVVCCCCHFVCVAAPLSSLGAKPALALPLCVSRRALPSSLLAVTSSASGRHCHRWVQDPLWRSCFVFHVVDHHHHFVHVVAPPSLLGARPALALPLHRVLPSSLLAITLSVSGRHRHRWVQDPLWCSRFVFHVMCHRHVHDLAASHCHHWVQDPLWRSHFVHVVEDPALSCSFLVVVESHHHCWVQHPLCCSRFVH
jgi:hypothetical protein